MDRREFEELSAGHALGALSANDEVEFAAGLDEHPEWSAIARRDSATVAALADAVAEVAPPPDIRAALLARIGSSPDSLDIPDADAHEESDVDALPALIGAATGGAGPLPTETIQTVARRNWTRGILALAASLVLLAGVGFGSAWLGARIFPQSAETVALQQIERSPDADSATVSVDGGGEATAYWSESVGQAVLVTDGIARLAGNETYELWLLRDGTAIAAGIFDVGSTGQATAILDGVMRGGDEIAVTVEPAGGSLDGTPSTDPVVVIPTSNA